MNKEELTALVEKLIVENVSKGMSEAQAKAKAEIEADSQKAVKDAEDKAKADKEIEDKVKEGVIEELKSINISNNEHADEKEVKVFDSKTGKVVGMRKLTPVMSGMNDMIRCLMTGDISSAKKLSEEIDADNDKLAKSIGKITPARSDSDAVGGYAVPTEVEAEIKQMVYDESVMYKNATKISCNFNDKVIPTVYGLEVADIADQSTAAGEKNLTFSNPTLDVKRAGGYTAISNTFINQKGASLIDAFIKAYGSAFARFLDLRLACGNVTTNSDLVDGMLFDSYTELETPIARTALSMDDLKNLYSSISPEAGNLVWIGNRKVKLDVGDLKDTAGRPYFGNFASGGDFSPLGIPFLENTKIPSTLDVGGDARTTGTDDVLILADMSKFVVALSEATRIDMSKEFLFTSDMTVLRGIKNYGCKVLMSDTTTGSLGGVIRALELNN